jgi:hypothetical protein
LSLELFDKFLKLIEDLLSLSLSTLSYYKVISKNSSLILSLK